MTQKSKKRVRKCQKCGDPIPKNMEAYVNGTIVCQSCWVRKHNKGITVEQYLRKLRK